MNTLPHIHLCVVQPTGYVHSLGLLDPARYFRHQFRRLGANVTLAKNRLRHDAVNFVFGAHLGFEAKLRQRYSCIFVNLEQLGAGGAAVTPAYRDLLASSAVVDYDAANVPDYADVPDDVPVVPLLHAPYLVPQNPVVLEARPIDLLFIGSMNPRREALLARIEAQGLQVTQFDGPLYGPERDDFIRQAKAVVNLHFYESSRFEQMRVSHCLSLGTPVISERAPHKQPHPAFEDSVSWVATHELEACFTSHFGTRAFFDAARAQLENFARFDPIEAYADLLAFAAGFGRAHKERRDPAPWRPTWINLGSGRDYKLGWLNLDVIERAQPDLLLDLGAPVAWPVCADSALGGPIQLQPGQADLIYANNVLEHVPDLATLMRNALELLKEGGLFEIEVPYEKAPTAWQDPTHLRALNENSWLYYTDWFWYLGWFEYRFAMASSNWLNAALHPCGQEQAAFMRVTLRKIATTPRERTIARTMHADFGGLDDDDVRPPDPPIAASERMADAAAIPTSVAA